ncbi:MAG TPA: V-type ATPase subunit, partial [Candidatus Saccharimonadales bacterium]|nr:V-type ATPase subunit [Candidatus Saccharimonadales bacterium]
GRPRRTRRGRDEELVGGLKNARKYGYSSARANAMKSKLLDKKTMQDITAAKDISTILSMLFERDYRTEIEEFGGLKIKNDLIDFALSKNLAKNILKLVRLSQGRERQVMQSVAGKWDLYNIRLAVEAKERKRGYDSIARYLIDAGRYNALVIKEAMREDSVESMLSKLMINSPYKRILTEASETYKKSKSAFEAISVLDREYYAYLARLAVVLGNIGDRPSAKILRMEIDMKNILTLIRAKRLEMKFAQVAALIIPNGNMARESLEQVYSGSRDISEMASQIRMFDLKDAVEFFKKDQHKQLLTFEIGIRNAMLTSGIRQLGHKILSFGTMLAYLYMKEAEVSMLRILINGKAYGIEKEDIERLIGWKTR